MSPSNSQFHYLVSHTVVFIAFGFIGWYLWPALKNQPLKVALPPLLFSASFRINGLQFLMTGVVSTPLPKAFANTFEFTGRSNSLNGTVTGGIVCAPW